MSVRKRVAQQLGLQLAPKVAQAAPGLTTGFVQQALTRAIRGAGPLEGAAAAADKELADHGGDVEAAIKALIETHVRFAGAQGFLTNIGGVVTMAVTVPANIVGLAVIECRMVAAIVHLRGYDLEDRRTRNAILAALVGEERLLGLISKKRLPGTPMAIATAPVHDEHLDTLVSSEVASELMTAVAGKKLATTVGRRVPVVGGVIGLGIDGYNTWKIGRYVAREFLPRNRR
jgi:hypothetical protein